MNGAVPEAQRGNNEILFKITSLQWEVKRKKIGGNERLRWRKYEIFEDERCVIIKGDLLQVLRRGFYESLNLHEMWLLWIRREDGYCIGCLVLLLCSSSSSAAFVTRQRHTKAQHSRTHVHWRPPTYTTIVHTLARTPLPDRMSGMGTGSSATGDTGNKISQVRWWRMEGRKKNRN